MNKRQVHQYVLEHIAGSLKARADSRPVLGIVLGISVVGSIIVWLSGTDSNPTTGLAICTLLSGLPLGVIAQRNTLRIALSRESLRLKRFLIGNKGYVAPKDHVLHQHADLFAIAANLVCQEPYFAPQSNAAAWHTYSVISDMPGIAAYVGWYGNNTQPLVFLFGDLAELTELSTDLWDLGHVRKFTAGDTQRFTETARGWKRQQLLTVGLAYATLPKTADPTNLTTNDLQENCVLLGALGLESNRGYQQNIPLNPTASVALATKLQATASLALVFISVLSSMASRLFGVPVAINMLLLLTVSVFITPLLFAVFSWDQATKRKNVSHSSIATLMWNGLALAVISYGTYVLYLYWQNAPGAAHGSAAHQTGAAITVLTFGLCMLIHVSLNRLNTKQKLTLSLANPLFLLAWSSSFLLILIVSYGTGPLLLGGIVLAIGAALFYGSIHELKSYADRHHSREHILELLKTS